MEKIQKLVVGSGEQDKKVILGIAVKFADDLAFYDCAFGLFVLGPNIKVITKYEKYSNNSCTGKSMSEAFILTSSNPQNDIRLFIDLPVQ